MRAEDTQACKGLERENGYYWVKFYNYEASHIMYWNGRRFEAFKSDFVDDEIEAVDEKRITQERYFD